MAIDRRVRGRVAIVFALLLATGLATVDALMTEQFYQGKWLGYSLAPVIVGMIIVCYRAPIGFPKKLIVIGVGSFGLVLIAMGLGLFGAMSVLGSDVYDALSANVEGIIERPADPLAYRSVFAIPITLVGLMFFVPTRRIWDRAMTSSQIAH